MILIGNQRGGGKDLALHLMKAENERVHVHQIRGFGSDTLMGAFTESYAISRATQCKQHLYSLSLNPPTDADVSVADFEAAIEQAEQRLGLCSQPRAIVFHDKRGDDGILRKHAHAVWCRIDTKAMKAVHHSHDHLKLEKLSRELFLHHGWELPPGHMNKKDRNPLNYSHAEHQQAKRAGKHAGDIRRVFQSTWGSSDTRNAFAAALKEQGYILARGDRRGFVAVDAKGEVYGIARALGIRTKEVQARLGALDDLPPVDEAHSQARQLSPSIAQEQRGNDSPAARRIKRDPEHILSVITEKDSVFTRRDIAKGLSAYIDDAQEYGAAFETVMTSKELTALNAEPDMPESAIKYSTSEMVRLERGLLEDARAMAGASSHHIPAGKIRSAIAIEDTKLRKDIGTGLSPEQCEAVRHVTGHEQLSCVIGVAGAGKSTMLSAARKAWETSGHRVFGAALAGKAAKGLEESSGIQSRSLASYELSWKNNRNTLQRGDILVIDEAGMIGARQMARFVTEAKAKGVKLVLVGDAEQLQPIEAGAPFRAMTENIQPAILRGVHRQKEGWQKQASKDFASGNSQAALQAYQDNKAIDIAESHVSAVQTLVRDYMNDFCKSGTQLALAHRRADVKAINTAIRRARQDSGALQDETAYDTTHGKRKLAAGDRILFTRNDRDLGVKNGMLGTVTKARRNRLSVKLDDTGAVTIPVRDYADFDHGYAATIHKSQGATVDRAYVLASRTMDRHLTYVAMTRHKQGVRLYADREEFQSFTNLTATLSRERLKQSTLDFAEGKTERRELQLQQSERRQAETTRQQLRLNTGLRGLLDRITGKHARTKAKNDREAQKLAELERAETKTLNARQSLERTLRQQKAVNTKAAPHVQAPEQEQLHAPAPKPNRDTEKAAYIAKRKAQKRECPKRRHSNPIHRGPSLGR